MRSSHALVWSLLLGGALAASTPAVAQVVSQPLQLQGASRPGEPASPTVEVPPRPALRGASAEAARPARSARRARTRRVPPPNAARATPGLPTPASAAGAPRPLTPASPPPAAPPPVTAAPVRASVRQPVVSPDLTPEIRPTLVGLPDPTQPLPLPRRLIREDDPYGQVGYRVGGFTLLPGLEQSIGYDSNPNRLPAPAKGSFVARTEGDLRFQSDWLTHEFAGFARQAYSFYPNVGGADRPEGEGAARLRLDVTRDTQLDVEGHYRIDTQRPGNPDLNATTVVERPLISTFGASVGAAQSFNHLQVELRGGVDRAVYEDARLPGGVILDQSDRDVTQVGVKLRASYEVMPGVRPFVDALADTRVYDRTFDNAGLRRDSDGFGFKAGSTFELTRTLVGEVSGGLQTRHYDDPRLRDLQGPLVDAALIWSATPLTTVRLRAATTIEETTVPGSAGAFSQRATLEVQHDLRRNLSVTGALTVGETDYRGTPLREEGFAASVRLDYRLTRAVAVRASFTHERLKSTAPGSDYTANVFLVGLRLQP